MNGVVDDELTGLVDTLRAGHVESAGEAHRVLRRVGILTGDPAASTIIMYPRQRFDHEPTTSELVEMLRGRDRVRA